MPLLDEIGDYLTAQGAVGGSSGWALMKADMPATPDKVVSLFETGGARGEPRYPLTRERFQVRVRGAERHAATGAYSAARAKIAAIRALLHGASKLVLGSTWYNLILELGAPIPIGYDENGRPEITHNYETRREE